MPEESVGPDMRGPRSQTQIFERLDTLSYLRPRRRCAERNDDSRREALGALMGCFLCPVNGEPLKRPFTRRQWLKLESQHFQTHIV
ncbi:hypothetical protein NDU88_000570 [Pleurodeles waltl]|uniref:Uncharacterized protein n=1 Tax=Pleurodeles waltl TaxID=8319 RepID=A0AAV7U5C8_PLEWA|nr:hypothetical protein NDU88_000570 [Pleurodeles waltl]